MTPPARLRCAVLVIGGGPAGMAAASAAAEAGATTTLLEAAPALGGQVWWGGPGTPLARRWWRRLERSGARVLCGARVVAFPAPGRVLAEAADAALDLRCDRLILAPGARERLLPFPGWTLPGVMGAGGLQALAKGGFPVAGRRVLVGGSGPLLLAAAAGLRQRGAVVLLIAEQAPPARLRAFAGAVLRDGRLAQAAALRLALRGVPYRAGAWVLRAHGTERLQAVTVRLPEGERTLDCEYLACGYGLVPNLELPRALRCALGPGPAVRADDAQATGVPGVYCAGEAGGIGGLEAALAEGEIAGWNAAGWPGRARRLWPARARARRFAAAMDRAFALRPELAALAGEETVVCRCEDVTLGQLRPHAGWREAKLQTRCGMGPCQGRICGPAAQWLLGWEAPGLRPPLCPVAVGTLAAFGGEWGEAAPPAGGPPAPEV